MFGFPALAGPPLPPFCPFLTRVFALFVLGAVSLGVWRWQNLHDAIILRSPL